MLHASLKRGIKFERGVSPCLLSAGEQTNLSLSRNAPPLRRGAATAKRDVKIYSRMDEAMIDYERADG